MVSPLLCFVYMTAVIVTTNCPLWGRVHFLSCKWGMRQWTLVSREPFWKLSPFWMRFSILFSSVPPNKCLRLLQHRQHQFPSVTVTVNWDLLEKVIVAQLMKKLPTFYGTQMFTSILTRLCHWILFWTRWIQ